MSEMLKVANSVLKLMVDEERPYGVKEVAGKLGLSVSRASRLLASMRELNWVDRVDDGRGYVLGDQVSKVGISTMMRKRVYEYASEMTYRLSRRVNTPTLLVTATHRGGFLLSASRGGDRSPVTPGKSEFPFPDSSAARVLWAFSRGPIVNPTVDDFERFIEPCRFFRDFDELNQSLKNTQLGFFAANRKIPSGSCGTVSAPIFVGGEKVPLAIVAQLQSEQMRFPAYRDLVMEIRDFAREYSVAFGSDRWNDAMDVVFPPC